MPRSNRIRHGGRARPRTDPDTGLDVQRALAGVERRERHPDGEWLVRTVNGASATKAYRCPGCQQEIPAGVAHVVAWPDDGLMDVTDRRHWHTPCWAARDRRRSR